MLQRILSSIVGLPLLVFLVISGGLPLKLAVMVLAIIGMYEFYKALSGKIYIIHYVGFLFAFVYIIGLDYMPEKSFNFLTSIYLLTLLSLLVIFHKKINVIDVAGTIFGLLYISFMISYVYLVREIQYGQFFVWLIFISAWGCDTGAYFVGKSIGKHKLIPTLSPNKTIEGAIGGVVFATGLSALYGLIIINIFTFYGINVILFCSIIAFFGSIFAQFGDLTASAIKRYTKIKDYGKIIPGHGGILDRFDSVIFTAPIVYYVIVNLFRLVGVEL